MKTLVFNRTFRTLALAFMRRYLRVSRCATRDGTEDGGYIVWMNENEYHYYMSLVRLRTDAERVTIFLAAYEKGIHI